MRCAGLAGSAGAAPCSRVLELHMRDVECLATSGWAMLQATTSPYSPRFLLS